jgi:serralysin
MAIITAPAGGGTVEGTAGGDQISGSAGPDVITTGSGTNSATGGGGDDQIIGGSNRDTLVGNDGNDQLSGKASNDTLSGRNGNDFLDGGAGEDRMFGGDGSDYLRGGKGDDFICGTDRSNGDSDVDYFAFDKSDGRDIVANFEVGTDKIYLEEGGTASLSYNAVNGNTTMTYAGTTVIFRGVDLTTLDAASLYATDSEIDAYGMANFGNPDFNM